MAVCTLLMLLFTFNELLVHVDAVECPKGHRVSSNGNVCEPCLDGQYQPDINDSKQCKLCTECYKDYGSEVLQDCTKVTDAICRCRTGFVLWDNDSSRCKCAEGSGLKDGVCSECKEGYFSTQINSECKRWTDCKSAGVKTKGSTTSDVICNEPNIHTSTSTTSQTADTLTQLKSHPPHEGARTQRMLTAITTTAAPRVTHHEEQPFSPSNTSMYFVVGPAILISGIVLLAAVTFKLYNAPCSCGKTTAQSM
ncbi:tumor necrosis factor receptor superfamily member 4 isoform X2 [Parambassis ranga]|uniref:Tumor necrosis factor receptor superfamily member 4 isoform X2 n=1 Tax=Parambassis ranga TaxID=210632 RepID=A0A6P7INV6_9TELE|nr:tumor necrosis factor receptor superfamily member 4-like isoform X2 [Parambassis ranga]